MAVSSLRTIGFAAAVCVVCATVVSSAAVLLRDRQQRNAELDQRRNVLEAAGLVGADDRVGADELQARFEAIERTVVEMSNGRELPEATLDIAPGPARAAPSNSANVREVPEHATVYKIRDEAGRLQMLVLPVEGQGLWSTLRGFLCLQGDLTTICGLTFHSHAETPGLGGEVDDTRWKARWIGRRAFDPGGAVRIQVAKGRAGSPQDDPYRVDGLTGATITSRGVTHLLHFWLGDHGFGPYLTHLGEVEG